jgi:hypothetical protein
MTPDAQLDTRFSDSEAGPTPWLDAARPRAGRAVLADHGARRRPPARHPLIGVADDEAIHFCTGLREQKARNLSRRPQVALTRGSNAWARGLDVGDGVFGSGEDAAAVFRIEPAKVLAFAKEPHAQTTFRFGGR